VSPGAEQLLDGVVSEMQAQVREIESFLMGASADVLRTRLDSLAGDALAADLKRLEQLITDHGLVDLRASLTLIVDRAIEATFEVAVIGRVSSGKSSLLNALVGAQVLPTGILPMTSVPTRLRRGSTPAIHITYAHGRTVSYGIERLGEYVTEMHNPGNEKRVARVLVDYPSDLLPEGVTFVDTPGLGSVASRGALQTFAYLPRCDHAAFLFDASAPLAEEDLGLLTFLRDAGIATSVLLSKADLLGGEDLRRVQTYVAAEVQKRLGAAVAVRPVSVVPSHAHLLRAWIADEVVPLGTEAVARRHDTLVRKVEILRAQAAAMLEQRTADPGTRALQASETAAIASRLRDVSAALERKSRELLLAELEARVAGLRGALVDLDRSLIELRFRFDAAEANLGRRFELQRMQFIEDASRLHEHLRAWIDVQTASGHLRRKDAFEEASRLATRAVEQWFDNVEPEASRLYRETTDRFVQAANDCIRRVATESADLDVDELPPEMGFRLRRQFYFTHLMHTTAGTPVTWLIDRFATQRVRKTHVERAAAEYLTHLLDTNSHRVENDFKDRARESHRWLEAQIRARLDGALRSAERAAKAALDRQHMSEAEAGAALQQLEELRGEVLALGQ
jgi:GTP-binding protein EngB required for normal cell division